MAIGDYLSTKAENEYNQTERDREQWEVEHHPEGEKLELADLGTGNVSCGKSGCCRGHRISYAFSA